MSEFNGRCKNGIRETCVLRWMTVKCELVSTLKRVGFEASIFYQIVINLIILRKQQLVGR